MVYFSFIPSKKKMFDIGQKKRYAKVITVAVENMSLIYSLIMIITNIRLNSTKTYVWVLNIYAYYNKYM